MAHFFPGFIGARQKEFPTLVGSTSGSSQTGLTVSMPGGLQVGDLLLILVYSDEPQSVPSGWSNITNTNSLLCWYRVVNGSETSFFLNGNTTRPCSYILFQIRKFTVASSIGFVATNSGNPPNLVAPWGESRKTLWLTALLKTNDPAATAPTNYNLENSVSVIRITTSVDEGGTTTFETTIHLEAASRFLEAASEDPASWNGGVTLFRACTIAISGSGY